LSAMISQYFTRTHRAAFGLRKASAEFRFLNAK